MSDEQNVSQNNEQPVRGYADQPVENPGSSSGDVQSTTGGNQTDAQSGQGAAWLTDDLQSSAQQYGLNPANFQSEGDLRAAMQARDMAVLQQAQQYQQYQQQQYYQQQPPQGQPYPPQQPHPPAQQQQAPQESLFKPYELKLDDDYGEDFVKQLNGMNQHYANQTQRLYDTVRQVLAGFGQQVGQQMQQYEAMQRQQLFESTAKEIDQKISSRGNYPAQQRQQLRDQVFQLMDSYAMVGQQPPAVDVLIGNVLAMSQQQQQPPQMPGRTPSPMPRPTQGQQTLPASGEDAGRQRAINHARRWWERQGMGHNDYVDRTPEGV